MSFVALPLKGCCADLAYFVRCAKNSLPDWRWKQPSNRRHLRDWMLCRDSSCGSQRTRWKICHLFEPTCLCEQVFFNLMVLPGLEKAPFSSTFGAGMKVTLVLLPVLRLLCKMGSWLFGPTVFVPVWISEYPVIQAFLEQFERSVSCRTWWHLDKELTCCRLQFIQTLPRMNSKSISWGRWERCSDHPSPLPLLTAGLIEMSALWQSTSGPYLISVDLCL